MIAEVYVPPTAKREPTLRQKEILAYIREFIGFNHFPPTVREIGDAVGLSSSSTVQNHLNSLERLGLITRRPGLDRTIVVLEDWKA